MNCLISAPPAIHLTLPVWLNSFMDNDRRDLETVESRMRLAIELAALNTQHVTGGPFAALIADMQTHHIIAVGVNLVAPANCSMAHAEMVAISLAQQSLNSYDLGAAGLPYMELISSCEPCAMCFGALPWSGIRHLACAARDEDARAIGFDEGPKHPDWRGELERRGIGVSTDICRDEARKVLTDYAATGGTIYNARQG